MKLNLGRRIVLFVYWLASLVVLATLVIPEYVGIAYEYIADLIPAAYMQYVVIALLAIYLLLSLCVLCMVFKRGGQKRADRGFITVDAADTGKVRIAMSAIEHMVRQAAYTVDGISDMKISLKNCDDAVSIQVNVTMVSGFHVPTVTLNMQRAIRQYVEMNCGVAVREVSVNIQSVSNPAEGGRKGKRHDVKPVAAPVQEQTAQTERVVIPEEVQPVPVEAPVYEPVVVENEVATEVSVEEPVVEMLLCDETSEIPETEENNEEEKEN